MATEQAKDAVEVELPEQVVIARNALADRIDAIAADYGNTLGIAVVDVQTGWTTGFNAETRLPQQSVSKLWVALTVMREVDAGAMTLDQPITLTREDLAVFHQPIRAEILRSGSLTTDIADLLQRALISSDNTANDAVLKAVGGPDAVRETIAALDLGDIRFGPGERLMQSEIAGLTWRQSYAFTRQGFFDARDKVPDARRAARFRAYVDDPVDGAAPLAIATALARLARGELLSEASTRFLLDAMADAKSGPRRLKGGTPDGWTIAHKTGTGQYYDGRQSGYNDVALLYAPDGSAYAIAVMIGETRSGVPANMDMMQNVTRAVAEYHEGLQVAVEP
ncbi:MAG: class A beta-lactamase [Alteraurantiacibacter sp.]